MMTRSRYVHGFLAFVALGTLGGIIAPSIAEAVGHGAAVAVAVRHARARRANGHVSHSYQRHSDGCCSSSTCTDSKEESDITTIQRDAAAFLGGEPLTPFLKGAIELIKAQRTITNPEIDPKDYTDVDIAQDILSGNVVSTEQN